MATFYQEMLPGTTREEAHAALDRAMKLDNSAFLQIRYVLVYREPEVLEALIVKKTGTGTAPAVGDGLPEGAGDFK